MNTITDIALDQLHESPFNYRKRFDEAALTELATDIKSQGRILQPLLVRPRIPPLFAGDTEATTGYEIVFGHRRYRAAQLASLVTAPCMVRSMTDEEVKKAQISENLQREDVHPIEEAEGFQALIDEHGMTAELIAEQHGKSRSYVYGRLKLLQACPQIRKACLAGEIGSEVALLIARLRTDKLQEKALRDISGKFYELKDGGAKSYRNIKALLNERYTLALKGAMFDAQDEMLLPSAGNCITCPKRTGNAPEFEDVATSAKEPHHYHGRHYGADVCTDPDCFAEKKKAHLKREAEKLTTQGKVVIDGNKARAAIDAGGKVKGAYIALKDVQAELKKAAKKKTSAGIDPHPQVVLIQDPRTGTTTKAVKREDVKAAGVAIKDTQPTRSYGYDPVQENKKRKEQEAQAAKETAARMALLRQVRAAAAASERTAFDLHLAARTTLAGVPWSDRETLRKIYQVEADEGLADLVAQMDTTSLALFIVDCGLVGDVRVGPYDLDSTPTELLAAAAHYSIDVAAARAEAQAPEQTAPTPSIAGAGAKKAKAAQAPKKATAKAAPAGQEQREEQTDDAGSAGGSDAQAELLESAEA